jgi:hypothetical protein
MAEGGDLCEEAVWLSGLADEDDAEVSPYGEGFFVGEKGEDGFGCSRGSYVVVFGLLSEEEIAHAAAGEEGLIAGMAQGFHDIFGSEVLRIRGVRFSKSGHSCPL